MNTQTKILLATTIVTALHFTPYIFAYLKYWGISGIIGNRENVPILPAWAKRAQAAHQNMNENFPHFAVLIILANYLDVVTDLTATGATIFFFARLAYLLVYVAGIRWVRSTAFTLGLAGEGLIVFEILAKGS